MPWLTIDANVDGPGGFVEVVPASHHVAEAADPVQRHHQDDAELVGKDSDRVDAQVVLLHVAELHHPFDSHLHIGATVHIL